jgi:hypothetical protein
MVNIKNDYIFDENRMSSISALTCPIPAETIGNEISLIVNSLVTMDKSKFDHIIFPGEQSAKITPRGKKSIPNSKLNKTPNLFTIAADTKRLITSLISISWSESLMGIIKLVQMANGIHYLSERTKHFINTLEDDPDNIKINFDIWYTHMKAYEARHGQILDLNINMSEDERKNIINTTRILNITTNAINAINKIRASTNERSISIKYVSDTILLKQPDFHYPLDRAFLEYFYRRRKSKRGYSQACFLVDNDYLGSDFTSKYTTFMNQFRKSFKEQIMISLNNIDYGKFVNFDNMFFEDMADLSANIIFDFGFSIYNYMKGATDRATSTTIQYRAIMIILLQFSELEHTSLTGKQCDAIRALSCHFIDQNSTAKKKQ